MTRAATVVPAETDLLCEGCGYTLNGLPESGNCPECGKPIAQSIDAGRVPSPWEQARDTSSFLSTTSAVLLRPTSFFRTLATRIDEKPARRFARIHWLIAALLLGIAGHLHIAYLSGIFADQGHWADGWFWIVLAFVLL